MTKAQWTIIGGPSREELFDALRLHHEEREVTFTVTPNCNVGNLVLRVRVEELGVEDGSGNNWLFKVYDRQSILGSMSLHGYINTRTREGWIQQR